MNSLRKLFGITWRSVLVGLAYVIGLLAAGMIAAVLGVELAAGNGNESAFVWLIISSLLLGVLLGPLAARLTLTRWQHFILWGSLIFFNLGSVAIEGAYFVPELVFVPIPVLFAQQLLASAGAALCIVLVFAAIGRPDSTWMEALRTRPWFSWLWRFLLSALSYLAFYFIFGALNFSLVTGPYYESHAGGLTVPAPADGPPGGTGSRSADRAFDPVLPPFGARHKAPVDAQGRLVVVRGRRDRSACAADIVPAFVPAGCKRRGNLPAEFPDRRRRGMADGHRGGG